MTAHQEMYWGVEVRAVIERGERGEGEKEHAINIR